MYSLVYHVAKMGNEYIARIKSPLGQIDVAKGHKWEVIISIEVSNHTCELLKTLHTKGSVCCIGLFKNGRQGACV